MAQRKSNFEILRIFSIICIIIFHCSFKSGFTFGEELGFNDFIIKTFWMLGELGVNLFVLISGFFMVKSTFKWKKLVLLVGQVLFYNVILTLIAFKLGVEEFTGFRNLFLTFVPVTMNRYWFFKAYIILYIVSPYLNITANAMKKDVYLKFLIVILTVYSVIPTVFGLFYNNTEGLLNYNRLIWLIIVYFIGGYIRLHGMPMISDMKSSLITTAASWGVILLSIVIIDKFDGFFEYIGTTEPAYLWPPNTTPLVFLSIGVFGIFANMNVKYIPVVNKAASTTLGIYLLHDGPLVYWIWRTVFRMNTYQQSQWIILRIIGVSLIIFVAGVIVDLVRQFIEKHTLSKILDLFDRKSKALPDKAERV